MERVSQYRDHAQQCRKLADIARDRDERTSLLLMAATWDTVANERLMILKPKTAVRPRA